MDKNRKKRKKARARARRENFSKKICVNVPVRFHVITREDIVDDVEMLEGFVRKDREAVEKYASRLNKLKRRGVALSVLCGIFNFAINSGLNFVSEDWNALLLFASIFVAGMPWVEFFICRGRLPFWKNQLRENLECLDSSKRRLENFDSNVMRLAQ